jgi:DNA-nicking Smr family endonuclease
MAGKDTKSGFNSPFGELAKMSAPTGPAKDTKLSDTRTVAEAKKVLAERERAAKAPKAPPPSRAIEPLRTKSSKAASEVVSSSEADEFLRAMGNVQKLDELKSPTKKKTERVEPEKRLVSQLPDEDSLALAELQALVEGDTPFRTEESEEFYSGSAPGVSQELVDKLRDGVFSFRRHVDLHGYTRDDGKAALIDFVAAARRDGERCVLVVTGRGKSSPGGISVLREALPRWLGRAPLRSHVLAYCTARSVDGGPGAFYVLLRRVGSKPFTP